MERGDEETRNNGKEEELLKRGVLVGKRGGNSTPSPTWKIGFDGSLLQHFPSNSARKLGANLWELQPQVNKVVKMSKIGPFPHNQNHNRSKLPTQPADPPDHQPTSSSSLGRDIAASLKQHHHHLVAKNGSLESPATYCSSMEMSPYKPVATPTSSKGKPGKSSYSLKTSSELLNILNRIWSLEEQHASNTTLVKALRKELHNSQRRVKELQEEKKRDREEIHDLMTLISNYKISRKKEQHNLTEDAIKRLVDELQAERKLRKHSENLQRKLSRQLVEAESSFTNALKELEIECKARVMLEELCDEFASGIKEYETEVRLLKTKLKKDEALTEEKDGLIIHISEAWLDERMQMKQAQSHHDLAEKNTIADKLRSEIQTFLKARRSSDCRNNVLKEKGLHRQSLESFPLNIAASAPRIENEDNDSFDNIILRASESKRDLSGKHDRDSSTRDSSTKQHERFAPCIEKITESNPPQTTLETQVSKDPGVTSSTIQPEPEEKKIETISCKGNKTELGNEKEPKVVKETHIEGNVSSVLEISDLKRYPEKRSNRVKTRSSLLNKLVSDNSVPSEAKLVMEHSFDPTTFTGPASPVKKWTSILTAPDLEVAEPSSKLPLGIKENTLKAKLLEARLENKQLQPRNIGGLSEIS